MFMLSIEAMTSARSLFICCIFYMATYLFSPMLYSEYHSQTSQDRILNETFFHGKRHGVFIDIGAYDGKTISNTYFYEKELRWRGICIEPLLRPFLELTRNRSCIVLNCAVGANNGNVSFVDFEAPGYRDLAMLSGELRFFSQAQLDQLDAIVKQHGGTSYRIFSVPMRTLNDILNEYKIFTIDYLSIDVEGGELDILQTLDYNTFHIHVMTVENNAREANPAIQQFLESKGFRFVMRLEQDEVYENMFF